MIAKDYFRRQATTLRKLVRITRNRTIADRLSNMADDFEVRAAQGADQLHHQLRLLQQDADGDEGHG
jgi:hypothetical protein